MPFSGVAGSVIGSAGFLGTTIGASGVTGALMSAGIISSTPIWVPLALGSAAVSGTFGIGYSGYRIYRIKQKIQKTEDGQETHFTEIEAKILEKIILHLRKKQVIKHNK